MNTRISKANAGGWKEIHAIADKLEPRVARAFLQAIDTALKNNRTTLSQIENALESRNITQVLDLLETIPSDVESALRAGDLTSALRDVYEQAGQRSMTDVLEQLRRTGLGGAELQVKFDLLNPRSVEFLRAYDGNLIRELANETRRSIIGIVQRGFEEGLPPKAQARRIKDLPTFGLTARQSRAVDNYRASLVDAGYTGLKLEKAVDRFNKTMLRNRAFTIARTETIRGSSYGQREAWKQAEDAGLVDKSRTRRKWIITPDDRLCSYCRAIPNMNPEGVGLDQPFQTLSGSVLTPPAHPNCRCAVGLTFFRRPRR